jgi:hypothetical protein
MNVRAVSSSRVAEVHDPLVTAPAPEFTVAASVTTLPEATVVTALPLDITASVVVVAANAGTPANRKAQNTPRKPKLNLLPKAEILDKAISKDNIRGPFSFSTYCLTGICVILRKCIPRIA